MSATVVDNIGLLVTNDPELGDGPLGLVRDAALVIEDGRVAAIERAGRGGRRADRRRRPLRDPGLRRLATPTSCSPATAPTSSPRGWPGAPYAGRRDPRHHRRHPRGRQPTSSSAWRELRRAEALRAGITHLEIKSGYGLDVASERRLLRGRGPPDRRRHLPRAPTPCRPSTRAAPTTTWPSSAARCSTACAPHCRWIDVFCERGAFDARAVARRCSRPAAPPASACACTATSSAPGPGVRLAVELGAASVDHCTYLDDDDVAALAGGETVATFLPATDFSTRQPYPDARRVIDAGATVAIATNCNPGSSYTTSMAFCIALAVRDMRMTADEALQAATLGGARALRRDDLGRLAPGARADAVVLDAPSHAHLVYRPGVPLVARTISAGRVM